MWVLEGNTQNPGKVHYLPCGVSLMVSRKEGHILLRDDASISRQHASITISHNSSNLKNMNALPEVRLRDLGAKYGTYVNEGIENTQKIAEETFIKDGDLVRFGMLANTWRLKYQPLVVTTSALQSTGKAELQTALVKLGGHLVGEWNASCSYLVMDNITLTIKVVCALAAARPIVTPEFFSKWTEAVVNRTSHPDANQFLPPLQEMSINQSLADFSPNEQRKNVLSSRHFLFSSSKQLKRMGPAVTFAGGTATLLSKDNVKLASSTNYLVVKLPPEKGQDPEKSSLFMAAKEILKENGLRVIPESDIGLAILYLTTDSHCNPSFKVSNLLKRNGVSSSETESIQIYATETMEMDVNSVSLTGHKFVPESGASRRTPATLPGTSFPLSNTGVPVSYNTSSSSSTNTNLTMMAPPESSLPRKHDSENKEIVGQRTSKSGNTRMSRPIILRPGSGESTSPQAKYSKSLNNESHVTEPEPTQPMENQDDSEEIEIESKFKPRHMSTQNARPAANSSAITDIRSPPKGETNVTNGVDAHDNDGHALDPMEGRSTFEPYTLPSLNVDPVADEDEISTQPWTSTTIKEEPASLPLDEPDRISGKRGREDLDLQSDDEWLGRKKSKKTDFNNAQVKAERSSLNGTTIPNPQIVKQEQHLDDVDPFALPNISERSRRRAEAKRKAAAEDAEVADPFSLPTSSRAERRRKLMKTEDVISKTLVNEKVEEPVTPPCDQQVPTTSNESRFTTNNEPWISKKSEGSVVAPSVISTKVEIKNGDVAELSGAFERSLVVVEVACLVRRPSKKVMANNNTQNTSLGNLKNFKQFRKNAADIISLPKIIGGKDLVAHNLAETKREDWFRENQDVSLMYEEREARNRTNIEDDLFDLPVNPRSRTRVRR